MSRSRRKSYAARRSQAKGDTGERIARLALSALGLRQIERIYTGVVIHEWMSWLGHGVARISAKYRVSADFRALTNEGRSVLVEVKARDDKLVWSDLKDHQRSALTEHHLANGLSLLVWITGSDVFVLRWPIDNFGYRKKALTPQRAQRLHITEVSTYGEEESRSNQGEASRVSDPG